MEWVDCIASNGPFVDGINNGRVIAYNCDLMPFPEMSPFCKSEEDHIGFLLIYVFLVVVTRDAGGECTTFPARPPTANAFRATGVGV